MRTRSFQVAVFLLVLVLVGSSAVYAGNENRKGTAGALELLIPVGARTSALSGGMMASVGGVEAIHWNPAGVSRIEGTEAMFSNLNYIADINVNYAAVATNMGGTGVLALSLKSVNFGDIPITTTALPEGTGGSYTPSYITFGVTYSNRFTDRIFGGATIKYVSEKIVRSSASGIALDLGVQYASSMGLKLGVVLKNLGPSMQFDGPDLEYFSTLSDQDQGSRARALRLPAAGFELPSTLEIGVGYDYNLNDDNIISIGSNFQNTNFGSDEFQFGLEYGWSKMVFARVGYMRQAQQTDNIYGPTFGLGVNVPLFGTTNVMFDYGYRSAEHFNANQWITLKVGI